MFIRNLINIFLCETRRHAGEGDLQDVENVARGQGVRSDQNPVNNSFINTFLL